jgi:hypothetical protein
LVNELGIDAAHESLAALLADAEHQTNVAAAVAILERDFVDVDGVGVGSVVRFLDDESNEDLRADIAGLIAAVVRRLQKPAR